ncbi:peptidoglycan recognition protein family protein [Phenylobacterium sp.]|uniref:peptidoglycan recognition protein family protein n=1 Tax=Phenylobacterium sp. TaxID=1871053 RepID=UPI0030026EC8
MSRPVHRHLMRFWLLERAEPLGLLLGGLIVVSISALVLLREPAGSVEGRVLRLGMHETETGSYPRAVVQLEARQITVNLPRASQCLVGDVVQVRCYRRAWGVHCGQGDCNVR